MPNTDPNAPLVKVRALNGPLTVTFTSASGATPTVYTDGTFASSVSLPATVAAGASTTFAFTSVGDYNMSVKNREGLELAAGQSTKRLLSLERGQIAAYTYDGNLFARTADDAGKLTPMVRGQMGPSASDFGMVGWSYDPATAGNNSILPLAGTSVGVTIPIAYDCTVTNIWLSLAVAGATLTAGQSFAALYQNNNLLAATADQAASWAGSTGVKTIPLATPQNVSAGQVQVIWWSNGTTLPTFHRGANQANALFGTGTARFFTANTGLTTTAPASLGALTASQIAWIVGLS